MIFSYFTADTKIKNLDDKNHLKKYHNDHYDDTYNVSSCKYKEKYNEEIDECFNDIKMQQQQGNVQWV